MRYKDRRAQTKVLLKDLRGKLRVANRDRDKDIANLSYQMVSDGVSTKRALELAELSIDFEIEELVLAISHIEQERNGHLRVIK